MGSLQWRLASSPEAHNLWSSYVNVSRTCLPLGTDTLRLLTRYSIVPEGLLDLNGMPITFGPACAALVPPREEVTAGNPAYVVTHDRGDEADFRSHFEAADIPFSMRPSFAWLDAHLGPIFDSFATRIGVNGFLKAGVSDMLRRIARQQNTSAADDSRLVSSVFNRLTHWFGRWVVMGPLQASANQVIALTYSLLTDPEDAYVYSGVIHGAAWGGIEQSLQKLRPSEKGTMSRRVHTHLSPREAATLWETAEHVCSLPQFSSRKVFLNCLHGVGHGAFGAAHLDPTSYKVARSLTAVSASLRQGLRNQPGVETDSRSVASPGTEVLPDSATVTSFIAVVEAAAADMMEERMVRYPGIEVCSASPSRELGYFCAMGYYHQAGNKSQTPPPQSSHASPRQPMSTHTYHALPCHSVPYHGMACHTMPFHPMLFHSMMPYHAIP